MPAKKQTFSKKEKLCSKTTIAGLFNKENTFRVSEYPLILVYKQLDFESQYPAQVLFSVGKKFSKLAIERNRIKRQLRELYRLSKQKIYEHLEQKGLKLAILFLFIGSEKFTYKDLSQKYELLVKRFLENIQ
jgi:ribonuclease P protein component